MTRSERQALIDRGDSHLSIARQCQLLKVARSTLYYGPASVSDDDLAEMRRLDKQYFVTPFYDARRMAAVLRRDGLVVNRKRIRRLMRVMGIEAIYQKAEHQSPASGTQNLSVLAAGNGDRTAESSVVRGYHLYPDGQGIRLSGGCDGLVQPPGAGLAAVDWYGHRFLCGSAARGDGGLLASRRYSTPIRAYSSPVLRFSMSWKVMVCA